VFAAGAAAKLVATLSTYPFLVIKSRQQARHTSGASPATHRPLGPLTEAWLLAREEGLAGAFALAVSPLLLVLRVCWQLGRLPAT
jgi:hypothetical protein